MPIVCFDVKINRVNEQIMVSIRYVASNLPTFTPVVSARGHCFRSSAREGLRTPGGLSLPPTPETRARRASDTTKPLAQLERLKPDTCPLSEIRRRRRGNNDPRLRGPYPAGRSVVIFEHENDSEGVARTIFAAVNGSVQFAYYASRCTCRSRSANAPESAAIPRNLCSVVLRCYKSSEKFTVSKQIGEMRLTCRESEAGRRAKRPGPLQDYKLSSPAPFTIRSRD
ncbi:hypothetical protein EVAR_14327_1 [Eumeta japonica]|uniref:Uncharacterized protein n=1 Tax=Eumeta variegata TaxID=151549 RepID=A0A4C1UNE0_EUMVA|nr:hypothetical protein EVAR_14327_1 [Eumeta japonica]